MPVAVLVPYRSGGCKWRDRAWGYIRQHYEREHGLPIIVGTCDGEWSKGQAVWNALQQTDADRLVIADADSWVRPSALQAAIDSETPWAIPHGRVHRLSQAATEQTYAGRAGKQTCRHPYKGVVGGGITVVDRDLYQTCPIDPRFYGWGGEDVSWGWALKVLAGKPYRGEAKLWHLWHPPANVGTIGSPESTKLARRWRVVVNYPKSLTKMTNEAREALCAAKP